MKTSKRWPAPAKINLFLHVTGRRDDGYHLLQTAFQFLDRCDWLDFTPRRDGRIERVSELAGVPPESDLVVRAARLLQQESGCGQGVDIAIEKILPMGGGIGGGSSDAATTMVALNCLWDTGLSTAELAELGLQLGADVPVFVHGRAAWAEGVGEVLSPIEPPCPWYLVIVPPCHVSTAEIFRDKDLTRDSEMMKIPAFLAGQGGENVCEPVVRSRYPEVDEAMRWLGQFAPVRMSGTGACVFAAFPGRAQAQQVMDELPTAWRAFIAQGLNRSPLLQRLAEESASSSI